MKPRLAHIITGLQTGGAELMLERLLERQEDSHFEAFVICLTDESPAATRIRDQGTQVICLNLRPGLPNPLAIQRIRTVLLRENASLAQTWLYHANLLGGLAAKSAGIPVFWGIHRSSLDPAVTSRSVIWTAKACRTIAKRVPASIVCCSDASRQTHKNFGYPVSKLTEIPNGFDCQSFRPDNVLRAQTRAGFSLSPADVVVGIIGRFVPLKNHRMFVEAAGAAARENTNMHFLMIGDGLDVTNPDLNSWIAETGFPERFHLTGSRTDTVALLNAMDIFCLTSNTEAFPLVLGEAMACAIPCVATDVGDCRRIVGDTGRIIPPTDTTALARAITELTDDAELRRDLGHLARERIAANFNIAQVANRYEELWQSSLEQTA